MSHKKTNDSKSNGWGDWQNKKNDWTIGNNKRPKLDIQKSHLSQSTSSSTTNKLTVPSVVGTSAGGGSSFRRTNSMPSSSKASPQSSNQDGFVDSRQEEFEANEAKQLAEAAAAIELEIAQSQLDKPSTSSLIPPTTVKPTNPTNIKNNGSSNFENLFGEELAAEDVEECMLLASQEIQASQNAPAVGDTSFSQTYNLFSKGVKADAHSSILETKTFKKPTLSKTSAQNIAPTIKISAGSTMKPPQFPGINRKGAAPMSSISGGKQIPEQSCSRSTPSNFQNNTSAINLKAEMEVRRLTKLEEGYAAEIKQLRESLRTREGESAILRSQLRQALVEREQHKSRSAHSAAASEQQFKEKLSEMEKQLESMKLKLRFQEAETHTAKERYKLLSSTSERLRLVEPQSPGTSTPSQSIAASKTPTRQRRVSGFLNRSTFEEPQSPRLPPAKRPRLLEEERFPEDSLPIPQPVEAVVRPETRSVGEQTVFDEVEEQRLTPLSLLERLSDRLTGIQLASVEDCNTDAWKDNNSYFDEVEPIPSLSLLKAAPKSKQRRDPLDDTCRPCLTNCTQSLKLLLSWNESTIDCPPTKSAICQIAEECTGILHYNLLIIQDLGRPSDKELRDRDDDIITRGIDLVPLANFDILDEKQWYNEEYGVEMRRCLGILSEIALVSRFAASLVVGTSGTVLKRHKITELPECALPELGIPDEDGEQFYFLRLFRTICSTVVDQKLTIAFNGVLAGILTLLRNCAEHKVLEEKGQRLFLNIIHLMLLARPASTVLLLLVNLLTSVSSCQTIMSGLCTQCDDEDNTLDSSRGLCHFTRSSCILQLLFIQLRAITEVNRWQITDSVSEWLVELIAQGSAAPSWILSVPGSSQVSHIACCIKFASTLLLLLSDAFQKMQEEIENQELPPLPYPAPQHKRDITLNSTLMRVMERSTILLRKLVENNMFQFMVQDEGLYELLVQGIERIQEYLNLCSSHERYLEDLLKTERDTDTDQVTVTAPEVNTYRNGCDLLKLS